MRKLLAIVLLSAALGGCATAPQTFQFDRSREYAVPRSVVWDRLIRYFATTNTQIKTLEAASGVVYAERLITNDVPVAWSARGQVGDLADCGKDFMAVPASQVIQFNVYVREQAPSKSSATVTVTFVETYQELGGWGGPPPPRTCNSTGALERRILDALERD